MRERQTDILIAGGGLGGIAAALAALRLGKHVIITEETDWIGGQLTAQAVPPDEHRWIEQSGCTASYRRLRDGIRDYYRHYYPLLPKVRENPTFNPGMGDVSRLCHEPRVAIAVLEEMLAPYRASRQVEVLLHSRPIATECDGDHVRALKIQNDETGEQTVIHALYILDATEMGDILPMAGVEHVIGAESQTQTGELHALAGEAQPLDQQAVSWCFALDYIPSENHTIERPETYDFWRRYQADFWPGPQLGWIDYNPETLETRHRALFDGDTDREQGQDFWHFRRIFYRQHYPQGRFPSDITLVNWPQIDYWLGPLLGVSDKEKQKHLQAARQLSLSMLYWMQTEAPRMGGGYGYPGLRLREDIVGTTDGLAKAVYIRESRRIQAEFTVLEQHVGVQARAVMGLPEGSELFTDSIGIGSYRIDLHPSTALRNYVDVSSYPFQIPLGALIPQRIENLLPANKNLGVTHITNGCYRLHPVEWNIGEAAGALAAYCLEQKLTPRQVRNTPIHLKDFQRVLTQVLGFELAWNKDARITKI
ncbi:FAD-dependent oxidoreductase [Ktedonospora formicarum]|uniref:FAD-dependent oxidoreductase n=1 Tax=Ktedonospora formicarum TaxID=2778364 RepID=A0A8J3MYP2_9CHLR|nr:FAD-dependent oxidoreductase [Ktedonospora formicarum]GHO51028.1 FAD-dependent oxidoreductase [Ktedonospora formicarum]